MRKIEDLANRLTDMDWGWWPFLALRPREDQDLNTARVARLGIALGVFYGTLLVVALHFSGRTLTIPQGVLMVAGISAGFLVVYRLTFAVFWNMRAQRLRGRKRGHAHEEFS